MQLLAGFEERSDLAQGINRCTRSRVPASARIAILDRESTDAAYLNATAPHECRADLLESGVYDLLHLAVLEIWAQLSNPTDYFVIANPHPSWRPPGLSPVCGGAAEDNAYQLDLYVILELT